MKDITFKLKKIKKKLLKKMSMNLRKAREVIAKRKMLFLVLFILISLVWGLLVFLLLNYQKNNKLALTENGQEINIEDNTEEQIDFDDEMDEEDETLGDFWLEIDTENLKIKSTIVEGSSSESLDQGIGHHVTTAFPNRRTGNVVLSGHRWLKGADKNPAREVFIDLDKLKVGDKIKIHYEGELFVYKVTGSKIFEVDSAGNQKEGNIFEQTEKSTITMYTCTPKKVDTNKRLAYFGELIEE